VLAHTDAELGAGGSTAIEVTPIGEGSSYLVRGSIQAGYHVPCARCLEPAPVSADGEICVHFVRDSERSAGAGDDEEAEDDSPDQRSFSGTRIDLRPLLAELVLLSYPMRALCGHGEACRGLCMQCGADLNLQPAGPCTQCGTADAQVPVASDADLAALEAAAEAPIPPDTSWKAALLELRGVAPAPGARPADPAAGKPSGSRPRKPGKKQ